MESNSIYTKKKRHFLFYEMFICIEKIKIMKWDLQSYKEFCSIISNDYYYLKETLINF